MFAEIRTGGIFLQETYFRRLSQRVALGLAERLRGARNRPDCVSAPPRRTINL
jgi:hypothetical protein